MWPGADLAQQVGKYAGVVGIAMLFNAMLSFVLLRIHRNSTAEETNKGFRFLVGSNLILGLVGVLSWTVVSVAKDTRPQPEFHNTTNTTNGADSNIVNDNHGTITVDQHKDGSKGGHK